MFEGRREGSDSAGMSLLKKGLKEYRETHESWMDDSSYLGAVRSIDQRLAQTESLLTSARSLASSDPENVSLLKLNSDLEEKRSMLSSLKSEFLEGFAGREETPHTRVAYKLSDKGRRYMTLEASAFVRENSSLSREEMLFQSRRYMTSKTARLSPSQSGKLVQAFCDAVEGKYTHEKKPIEVRQASVPSTDFADALLYI